MNKIISVIVILYLTFSILQFGNSDELLVHFLDVGQGDSILIQIPGGYNVLVDGGEGNDVLIELGRLLPPWDRSIDLMILTHPHLDHLGGLIEVLDRYEVKELWLNPIGYKIPEFLVFIDKVHSDINSIKIVFPNKGYLVEFRNLDIKVIWPQSKTVYRSFVDFTMDMKSEDNNIPQNHTFSGKEVNNSSIILLLSYGKFF
jgi:competence protein ComEC